MAVTAQDEPGAPRTPARWIENHPRKGWRPRLDVRELWDFRDVCLILAERDMRVRYKQTLLGVTWVVLQPLLAMVVFTLVLGEAVGVPSDGVPYAAFVLAGLAVWSPLSSAISESATSLVAAPDLVTKVYFPRLLAPLGSVLGVLVDFAVALVIAQLVALIAGVPLQPTLPLVLLLLPAFVLVALAFGFWLAAMSVLYRDVAHALGFALQLLLFLSPVVYPLGVLSSELQTIASLNPIVGLIDATRWAMLGTDLEVEHLVISSVMTVVLIVSGVVYFRRVEPLFADRM
ncbi:MAG: ABC transporter permease [Solirubrobacteraceae bacterium]|nr:ABC transporter permease [Solirubrobacteraceae bacterium]